MKIERVRVVRSSTKRVDLSVLRKFVEYQAERKEIGTTRLNVRLLRRCAKVSTLENGEHLLLLMQDDCFLYFEAVRAPYEHAYRRAHDWVTEAPTPSRS